MSYEVLILLLTVMGPLCVTSRMECAGEVVEVGSDVRHVSVDDKVIGFSSAGGGLSDYCDLSSHELVVLPKELKNVEYAQAAALSTTTVYISTSHSYAHLLYPSCKLWDCSYGIA